MSILEISHRSPTYEGIHADVRSRLLRLMKLDESEYTVLLLGGGASLQFAMLPMNFLSPEKSADYVHTGEWPGRAIQEAKRFGKVRVVASSEGQGFSQIPDAIPAHSDAAYLHLCTNNTIEGTQLWKIPDSRSAEGTDVPLVADCSSDILSREFDYSRFSMIYAGAQKNLGPAGVTVIVMRKSFLARANRELPTLLSYLAHEKAGALYNTPPVYAVYVMNLVLKWIEAQGGVAPLAEINRQKSEMIYQALDARSDLFELPCVRREDRSRMNITFRFRRDLLSGDALKAEEKRFLSAATALKMDGLAGHRSVGGFRASIYNAFPREGCEVLAEFIRNYRIHSFWSLITECEGGVR
jgi:phosphoserine aminotransferase